MLTVVLIHFLNLLFGLPHQAAYFFIFLTQDTFFIILLNKFLPIRNKHYIIIISSFFHCIFFLSADLVLEPIKSLSSPRRKLTAKGTAQICSKVECEDHSTMQAPQRYHQLVRFTMILIQVSTGKPFTQPVNISAIKTITFTVVQISKKFTAVGKSDLQKKHFGQLKCFGLAASYDML